MKKIIFIICSCFLVISLSACSSPKKNTNPLTIVATNFPGYDFARAIVGNDNDITLLLKPGQESHDYDPTPQDIITIEEADIFIYTGGESDTWVKDMLKTIDNEDLICIRMMDYISLYQEETVEGMQVEENPEEEYDEHVWTSPKNTIVLVQKIAEEIEKKDVKKASLYQKNADAYIKDIKKIDTDIKDIVKHSKRKELIFGDRFPFRYLVEEYGLTYYAAFPGCSFETEVNAQTISFLIDKVKEDHIPVVLHIELSNSNIAKTISQETGAKIALLHSAHNLTEIDFLANKTYVDIMKENIESLKEALQ